MNNRKEGPRAHQGLWIFMEDEEYARLRRSVVKHLAMSGFKFILSKSTGGTKVLDFEYDPDTSSVIFNGKKYGPISFWDAAETICETGEIIDAIIN